MLQTRCVSNLVNNYWRDDVMGPLNLAFMVQDEHYCSDTTTAKPKLCQRRMEWMGLELRLV